MSLFGQKSDMPTSVLGLAQGFAENVGRGIGEPMLSSMGLESEERQVMNIVEGIDLNDMSSVTQGFKEIMNINPKYASEFRKQVTPFLELTAASAKAQPDVRKQQLVDKENRNIAASAVAQQFGPRDTMEQMVELRNKLNAAGLGDTSTAKIVGDEINAFKSEHFKEKKEQRVAKTQEQKQKELEKAARWKPVYEQGEASKIIYNLIDTGNLEAGGFNTEEKKTLSQAIGGVINTYDNKLSAEKGIVSPTQAANYYTKALKLPQVYNPSPEQSVLGVPIWDASAAYNHENFIIALDKTFNRNNQKVSTEDLPKFLKEGLIIPGVTVISTPQGDKTFSSEAELNNFKKKYGY